MSEVKALNGNEAEVPQAEAPRAIMFPETPEQLDIYIAGAMANFLNIPENGTLFAQVLVSALARSLTNDRERLEKDMNRLILVKAPFPGSIRAETFLKSEAELGVNFKVQGEGASWVDLPEDTHPGKIAGLTQFVLAKATVPSEVWYVTTSLAVDKAAEEGANLLAQANGVQ